MTDIPSKPDPEVLVWFGEPRSFTQASKLSGYHRQTLWAHMKRARQMGLVVQSGETKDRMTSCTHRLYTLTPAGVDYLEEYDE